MIYLALLTLVGLLCGFLLALIAPEELVPGRKYFLLLKHFFFLVIATLLLYALVPIYLYAFIPVLLVISFYLLNEIKLKNPLFDLAYYPFFLLPFFVIADPVLQIILATAIFLYGFPLGTLLKDDRQKS